MKTTITIRKSVLEAAEPLAKELRLSRSQLVEQAVETFLQRYKNRRLLAEINAAYADPLTQPKRSSF